MQGSSLHYCYFFYFALLGCQLSRFDHETHGYLDWRQTARGKAQEKMESMCDRGYEYLGNKRISEISKKLAWTCGVLYKIRSFLPTETLVCLYNSLFMSFLQCGITVWGQMCASYIDPIIKLQKKAVRIISHQSLLCHTTPTFKALKLLKLPGIFKIRLSTFVFESLNKLAPHYFHSYLSLNSSIHSYNTRHSSRGDIYVEKKNTLQFG